MENPDPRRYREAEVALWMHPGTYRGFVRTDPAHRLVNRLQHWDRVEPLLSRNEAERLVDDLASAFDLRWNGDTIVARLPEADEVLVGPDEHGLYPVGALHDFRNSIQWTEPFPHMPHGDLDAQTIVDLLDTPLPKGVHPRNRQPVWDELDRRAEAAALVEALGRASTAYAQERLCVLLAHHDKPRECLAALELLTSLLDAADDDVRSNAAYAIRELVARAGRGRALAAAPGLADELRPRADEDDDLAAALGALDGEAPRAGRFVREARRALDFLVGEYGFEEPTIDDGGWGTDVIYRTELVAVVARAEWRDRYAEVLIVGLVDGDLPMYLGTEGRWLAPERIAGVDVPTYDADAERLAASFDAWALALRGCEQILRGDVEAYERAVRASGPRS